MNVGAFTMDPGKASGLAWAIFDPGDPEGAAGALRNKMMDGSRTTEGNVRDQIREISHTWAAFYRTCVDVALLPPDRVWFISEDFIYAPGVNYEGESAMFSTALIWGVEGYRMGRQDEWRVHKRGLQGKRPDLILQPAGQASTYATGPRLRDWGLWVVGREHERSAWKHFALFVSKYIDQHGNK